MDPVAHAPLVNQSRRPGLIARDTGQVGVSHRVSRGSIDALAHRDTMGTHLIQGPDFAEMGYSHPASGPIHGDTRLEAGAPGRHMGHRFVEHAEPQFLREPPVYRYMDSSLGQDAYPIYHPRDPSAMMFNDPSGDPSHASLQRRSFGLEGAGLYRELNGYPGHIVQQAPAAVGGQAPLSRRPGPPPAETAFASRQGPPAQSLMASEEYASRGPSNHRQDGYLPHETALRVPYAQFNGTDGRFPAEDVAWTYRDLEQARLGMANNEELVPMREYPMAGSTNRSDIYTRRSELPQDRWEVHPTLPLNHAAGAHAIRRVRDIPAQGAVAVKKERGIPVEDIAYAGQHQELYSPQDNLRQVARDMEYNGEMAVNHVRKMSRGPGIPPHYDDGLRMMAENSYEGEHSYQMPYRRGEASDGYIERVDHDVHYNVSSDQFVGRMERKGPSERGYDVPMEKLERSWAVPRALPPEREPWMDPIQPRHHSFGNAHNELSSRIPRSRVDRGLPAHETLNDSFDGRISKVHLSHVGRDQQSGFNSNRGKTIKRSRGEITDYDGDRNDYGGNDASPSDRAPMGVRWSANRQKNFSPGQSKPYRPKYLDRSRTGSLNLPAQVKRRDTQRNSDIPPTGQRSLRSGTNSTPVDKKQQIPARKTVTSSERTQGESSRGNRRDDARVHSPEHETSQTSSRAANVSKSAQPYSGRILKKDSNQKASNRISTSDTAPVILDEDIGDHDVPWQEDRRGDRKMLNKGTHEREEYVEASGQNVASIARIGNKRKTIEDGNEASNKDAPGRKLSNGATSGNEDFTSNAKFKLSSSEGKQRVEIAGHPSKRLRTANDTTEEELKSVRIDQVK